MHTFVVEISIINPPPNLFVIAIKTAHSTSRETFSMHRFVKFVDEEAAKNSIVEVNGKYFQGAKLSVSVWAYA